MRMIHATTSYWMTYVRLLAILIFCVGIVFIIPYHTSSLENFFSFHAVNVGVLYAILVGFIMSLSLMRKHELEEEILLELNKIRRIFHLSYHLSVDNVELKRWFEGVQERIYTYLYLFKTMPFSNYERGSELFRRITYALYQMPEMGVRYNAEIYGAILEAAGTATEAREYIYAKKETEVGRFQWGVILFVALVFSVVMVSGTPFLFYQRLVTAIVVYSLFLALDLVYEYDHANKKKYLFLANLYVKNAEKLKKGIVSQ